MTEKEKAKAYDKAIERAKKLYSNGIAEEIFPELKESEDEKIKNAILNHLKKMWGNCQDDVCGVHVEDAIDWLEKQRDKDKLIQELGEYKVKYTQEVLEKYVNSMSNKDDERLRKTAIAFLKDFAEQGYENAVECIAWLEKQGENSADKIEPRFKVGDWVVNKSGDSYHIDNLNKKNYKVSDGKGNYNYFSISKQDEMRLWNILDAKDGDVLCYRDDIILFKSYFVTQGSISMYCWYNRNTNNFYGKEIIYTLSTKHKIYPATKEQRDVLMKAINDAGYENVKNRI